MDTPVAITYSYKSFVDLTIVYGYKFKGIFGANYSRWMNHHLANS
ncbi:hypothetical protein [Priestia megaterium]|nr:hypothetical protein [Priestia megaterium]